METTIVYWGYIGIMAKKTETILEPLCRLVSALILGESLAVWMAKP